MGLAYTIAALWVGECGILKRTDKTKMMWAVRFTAKDPEGPAEEMDT
jgi:hypothetical protein